MSFAGLRVVAFESRRSTEMAQLIRNQGGDPFVAPSMREAPLERNEHVHAFAKRLATGEFDMMIFLTGVGTRALDKLLGDHWREPLRKMTIVARGPKPVAALTEMNVPVTIRVPEPNTWRELLQATEGRSERNIAVQEYGKSNRDLLDALQARGATVTPVRVYQWDLPEDTKPLREAARRISAGEADVALFTTSIQVPHLFQIAEEDGMSILGPLQRMVIGSIGPTTSEMLSEFGVERDLEPSHPKMGFLVKETAEQAAAILERKRR
jgi:uroporphyrinogen-III synthase